MTDKERLEEVEAKYSTLTVSSERDGIEYAEVDVEDLVFLIQNGFKQAERVQGLEEDLTKYRNGFEFQLLINNSIKKQNKRYREAIKECIERMNEGGAGTRSFVYEKLIEVLEGNNDA